MKTDAIQSVLMYGIKATGEMTNLLIGLLPDETSQKVKSAGTTMLKKMHEVTGEMIAKSEGNKEAEKPKPTSVIIE